MGQIKVEKNVGGIEGLCVIEPAVHGDARGYFMETYNEKLKKIISNTVRHSINIWIFILRIHDIARPPTQCYT